MLWLFGAAVKPLLKTVQMLEYDLLVANGDLTDLSFQLRSLDVYY
jgi:hypothetical protein